MKDKAPVVLVEVSPDRGIPRLVDVDELMCDDLRLERIEDRVWNGNSVPGPGMRHLGFAALGHRYDRGSIWPIFYVFESTVLASTSVAIGNRPRGDPGQIERIVFGVLVLL